LKNKCNSNKLVFNTANDFLKKNNFTTPYMNNSTLENNTINENEGDKNINIPTGTQFDNQSILMINI
jgi:hypothetical protein